LAAQKDCLLENGVHSTPVGFRAWMKTIFNGWSWNSAFPFAPSKQKAPMISQHRWSSGRFPPYLFMQVRQCCFLSAGTTCGEIEA
jgi:hypothetical protein